MVQLVPHILDDTLDETLEISCHRERNPWGFWRCHMPATTLEGQLPRSSGIKSSETAPSEMVHGCTICPKPCDHQQSEFFSSSTCQRRTSIRLHSLIVYAQKRLGWCKGEDVLTAMRRKVKEVINLEVCCRTGTSATITQADAGEP